MITSIRVKNYRSCLNVKFKVQPDLSILIGPNSSGKTNVLSCFLLLKKLLNESGARSRQETATGQCLLSVVFKTTKTTTLLTAKIETYTSESNIDVIVKSKQKWEILTADGKRFRVDLPIQAFSGGYHFPYNRSFRVVSKGGRLYAVSGAPAQTPDYARKALDEIAVFLNNMRYYSASQFTNPSRCPVSFELEDERDRSVFGRTNDGGGLKKFLRDLYAAYKSPEKSGYEQFIDIIGAEGIGLINKIAFQGIITSSIDYRVRSGGKVKKLKRKKSLVIPRFLVGKQTLSPNQLSEGTFKTIALIFYLITEKSSLLLVEEPEVCIHQGLLSSIVELIKQYSREKQIILSTHSDFVLGRVAPENVYKVSISVKEGTKVNHIPKSMSRKEFAELKNYLATEGNLGEYWRHGGLGKI